MASRPQKKNSFTDSRQMAQISIIIPCYNCGKTILKCLESVKRQSCRDFELIAVDDASQDDTVARLQAFLHDNPEVAAKILRHERNQGVSKTRNDGLAAAEGAFIAFLDADDELDEAFCAVMTRTATEEDADMVCGNIQVHTLKGACRRQVRGRSGASRIVITPGDGRQLFRALPYFDSSCAKIFRRSVLLRCGIAFNNGLRYAEDTLFSCSVALNARRIVLLPGYCGYHYLLNDNSCSVCIDPQGRLDSLKDFLVELERRTPETARRILLRKSLEYVWTIKKYGGDRKRSMLDAARKDGQLFSILDDSIRRFGGFKHRMVWRFLRRGVGAALKFW